VTKRVDRLVERGLVTRRVGERDARGRVIALTADGRDLIDRAFEAHMANEHRLLGALSEADRRDLERVLEAWGRQF
jgi:DNA-binding MarR family transcriptional regulator